jgi:hypothetical protein
MTLCFRIHHLWGNSILFASEESSNSVWCGREGRACVSCGEDNADVCADRTMDAAMAAAVSKLGSLVMAEWPTRKYQHVLVYEHCIHCVCISQ